MFKDEFRRCESSALEQANGRCCVSGGELSFRLLEERQVSQKRIFRLGALGAGVLQGGRLGEHGYGLGGQRSRHGYGRGDRRPNGEGLDGRSHDGAREMRRFGRRKAQAECDHPDRAQGNSSDNPRGRAGCAAKDQARTLTHRDPDRSEVIPASSFVWGPLPGGSSAQGSAVRLAAVTEVFLELHPRQSPPRLYGRGGEPECSGGLGNPDAGDVCQQERLSKLGRERLREGPNRRERLAVRENLVRLWHDRWSRYLLSAPISPRLAASIRECDVSGDPRDPLFEGELGLARRPAPIDRDKTVVDEVVESPLGYPSCPKKPTDPRLVFEVEALERDVHQRPLHRGGSNPSPRSKPSAGDQAKTERRSLEDFGRRPIANQVYTAAKEGHHDAQSNRQRDSRP